LDSRVRPWGLLVAVALALTSCSTDRDPGDLYAPGEVGVLVVDARLLVGRPLGPIYLRQTLAPGEPYTPEKAAVSDAQIFLTTGPGSSNLIAAYLESPTTPGRYEPIPANKDFRVQPNTTYLLTVEAGDRRAEASTTTPGEFDVYDWALVEERTLELRRMLATYEAAGDSVYQDPANQLVYLDGLLEARFTSSGASAFQVGLLSLDPGSEFVIDPSIFDEEELEDLGRASYSPALEAADDFIRMPWFAIFFAGRYKVYLYAVDRNWYDLVRTSRDLGGGPGGIGGNAGDDFERPIFHIEGGIGLFGSAAVDSIGFTILPRP